MSLSINDITEQLQQDMSSRLDPAHLDSNDVPYYHKPNVIRGFITPDDADFKTPVVCFDVWGEGFSMAQGGKNTLDTIKLTIYGYTRASGMRNSRLVVDEDVFELCHDVLYFLFSDDWTYATQTRLASEVEYFHGGPTRPISMFMFDIEILRTTDLENLRD